MPEPSLHHVGYIVASVAEAVERWKSALSVSSASEAFDDPIQKARVLFLEFAHGGTSIELVEPLTPDAPVARFLEKGGGLHHVCFEVDDIEKHTTEMKAKGAMLIRRPKPAVAFDGRLIAWMLTTDKLLVEYLERPR